MHYIFVMLIIYTCIYFALLYYNYFSFYRNLTFVYFSHICHCAIILLTFSKFPGKGFLVVESVPLNCFSFLIV